MKLNIIVGTRPEIIRLSSIIKLAKQQFNTTLIHTGQNYDYNLNEVFFQDLDLPNPDVYLNCSTKNLGDTVGDIISKSYQLFLKEKPDALLILGDTNSCLCAYSAKRLKIPIFHVEAGNRCFDPNVPEELNRKIIDHLSDVNMCYMEHARRNLLQEGISQRYLFVVGSPMKEVIKSIEHKKSDILEKMGLKPKEYFVWSTHREENVSKNEIFESLNELARHYQKKVIFACHPRTKKVIEERNIFLDKNIILINPLGIIDYLQLQRNALCVLSDSGTLTEESNILKFKGILIRTSTEHPEGVEAGTILIGNTNWDNLKTNVELSLKSDILEKEITDYEDINVSQKVCNIISGYYSLINKYVWLK